MLNIPPVISAPPKMKKLAADLIGGKGGEAVRIGDTTDETLGNLRVNGGDLQFYNGAVWVTMGTISQWKEPVANPAALPLAGNTIGDMRLVIDDGDGNAAVYQCKATVGNLAAQWDKIADVDWGNFAFQTAGGEITSINANDKLLIGSAANTTDWTNAQFIASFSDTGNTSTEEIGILGEAEAVAATAHGVYGIANTNGVLDARAVTGIGKVKSATDSGTSFGVHGVAEVGHTGGDNIGVYGSGQNASASGLNYSFFGANGIMYNAIEGQLTEIATPGTNPVANDLKYYAKDDGSGNTHFYVLDSAGVETDLMASSGQTTYDEIVTTGAEFVTAVQTNNSAKIGIRGVITLPSDVTYPVDPDAAGWLIV